MLKLHSKRVEKIMYRLEEKLKDTGLNGEIKNLFEGGMQNYIECTNIDYKWDDLFHSFRV